MLKFNLVENALDSLEHAIEHLNAEQVGPPRPGTFKRVIRDLAHVAELLLKERLRRIHPAFVFSNVDKYPSGRHTVSARQALERLRQIGCVEFKDADRGALKTMRNMRNEIEHYEFDIKVTEAKVVVGGVLAFIFRFASNELQLDWAERRLSDPEWVQLNDYTEFYVAQRKSVLEALDASGALTTECPRCYDEVFDIELERCALCGHVDEIFQCPSCNTDYFLSDTAFEDTELCPRCAWEDAYASYHYERY